MNIKKQLIEKRKIIKKKLNLLKHGEIEQQQFFSPLTTHLQTIANKLQPLKLQQQEQTRQNDETNFENKIEEDDGSTSNINQHFSFDDKTNIEDSKNFVYNETPQLKKIKSIFKKPLFVTSSPYNKPYRSRKSNFYKNKISEPSDIKQHIINETIDEEKNQSQLLNPSTVVNEQSFIEYLDQYDSLPRKYIREMIQDDKNEFDHKYGVRHNTLSEKFYIGDSLLEINGSDVVVKGKRYRGTIGLYELLFKKYPKNYSLDDEKAYKEIVLKTNAARRYYQYGKQIDGSRLEKYKKIIAPTVGRGMLMQVNNSNSVDYIYWNNPNELVERLRLLLASKEAGHTGHTNEINSIIEELRESEIIA